MSFLEQFLKESSLRRAASADSEEGDIEDNRAPSVLSSSNNSKSASDLSPQHGLSPGPPNVPSQMAGSPYDHRASSDRSSVGMVFTSKLVISLASTLIYLIKK